MVRRPPRSPRFPSTPLFRSRVARVGHHAGASRLGASVYEIGAGGRVSPYHLHHGNEELLVVLAGTPEVRTPAGTRTLEPGAVRSEEHTSELQSRQYLVCRLL